jgi:PAS domain S-box-containing protein
MSTQPAATIFPDGLPLGKQALRIAAIAAAYFLAHQIAFVFPDTERVLMAFWPAGGVGLAALLLSPHRAWPAILVAVFIAGNLANLHAGRPFANSLGFMTANAIESLACAWFIRRFCGDIIRFDRLREIAVLLVAATVINAGTACIGALTATLTGMGTFGNFWESWWVSDGLGILIAAPFFVSWWLPQEQKRPLSWARWIELASLLLIWTLVVSMSFSTHDTVLSPRPYMLPVLLAWPALRFGARTVTLALVVLVALSVVSDATVLGPMLWSGHTPVERLLALQIFLAFCAATGFVLMASAAEARRADRESREDHDRLRALGDNLPNGMVFQVLRELDGTMRFVYVSGGCYGLNGTAPETVLADASSLLGLVHEEDRIRLEDAQAASARDMSMFQLDLRFRRPGGELRWMHLASSPRRLPNGCILWDGIQLDITERKHTEELLRDAQRLESVAILAGGIAHDFNNLLAIIVGNLSLAQTGQRSGSAEHAALEKASEACARAADLSHRLMTFTKGGTPVRMVTRLGPLVVDTVKLALSGSNVAPAFDLPDDMPNIEADEGQLRQVFSNLAINARDAMPSGGTLHIESSVVTIAKDELAGLNPGRYHAIIVRDEGHGIPPEIIHRIFEPYFTTKEMGTQKGQGLGLSICHSIVGKHGGTIRVTSTPGQGTTFTIYLPACDSKSPLAPRFPLPDKISVRGHARRILVLDDEPDMRTMIEHLLRRFGHEVVTTGSGSEAVHAYREARTDGNPFDLVILDLTLQGNVGGLETFQELRAIDGHTKAIVTTGYTDDPVIQSYRSHGFSAALTKPFSIAAIKAAIEATQ